MCPQFKLHDNTKGRTPQAQQPLLSSIKQAKKYNQPVPINPHATRAYGKYASDLNIAPNAIAQIGKSTRNSTANRSGTVRQATALVVSRRKTRSTRIDKCAGQVQLAEFAATNLVN